MSAIEESTASGESERFLHEAAAKVMHGSVHSSPNGSPVPSEGEKAPSSTGSIRESRSRSKSHESQKSQSRVSPVHRHSRSRSRSRSRSYRRYRTRSRSRSGGRKRYYSHSRSRSPYSKRKRSRHGDRRRSHSRSPMSGRRRHVGNREAPKTSNCVGVFGLSLYTQERDLRDYFGRYGPIDEVQIVHDHQTGRSRGFGFIYYRNLADAVEARERAPGTELDGRKLRVDYSITERAHTPTPGIYLGKPTPGSSRPERHSGSSSRYGGYRGERERGERGERGERERGGYGRRSPSPAPYYRRRGYSRSRSRSRSYSPRNDGEE